MENCGYTVTLNVLNAKDFGVPQSRERMFITGVKKGFPPILMNHFESHKKEAISLRQAIKHLGRAGT